jgi:hypothetical protein
MPGEEEDVWSVGGDGLPRIAERIEYSSVAASEPKLKLGDEGSNGAKISSGAGEPERGIEE